MSVTATNSSGSTSATSTASLIAARVILTARFNAVLRSGQEVTRPNGTRAIAAGHFSAKLTGKSLSWTLTFAHLSGRPTVAVLNKGQRGANGPPFKSLCHGCMSPTHGTATLTTSQVDAMLHGQAYVNLRTIRNRFGEIRGQINHLS